MKNRVTGTIVWSSQSSFDELEHYVRRRSFVKCSCTYREWVARASRSCKTLLLNTYVHGNPVGSFSQFTFASTMWLNRIYAGLQMTENLHSARMNPVYLSDGGEKCEALRKYFNKKTRVTIQDGRVFIGIMNVWSTVCGITTSLLTLLVELFCMMRRSTFITVFDWFYSLLTL